MELTTPIPEDAIAALHVGDTIELSGWILCGRDAVLPKVVAMVRNGTVCQLGVDLRGQVVFHTAVSPAGVGPTSSNKLEIESSIEPLSAAGIKIHRISCPNAARLFEKYPYRLQKVIWQETASSGDFQVTLTITAERDQAILSSIVEIISAFKVSLRSLGVAENGRDGTNEITVRLLVPSNLELDKVVSQIGALKRVLKVKRV